MFDLVVRNGRVLLPEGVESVSLGIQEGKVAGIFSADTEVEAQESIDAATHYVFPGIIDAHFHCRAPSFPEREDFASGTAAAAVTGVTSVFEMPISVPATSTTQRMIDRMAVAAPSLYVDMGFYGSCGSLDYDEIHGMIAAGAIGIKAFLQSVPEGRESEFSGICLATDVEILRAFELLRGVGLPCAFHAEANDLLTHLSNGLIASGRRDPQVHPLSRPPFVEAIAVAKLLVLADEYNVPLHVPHVSSKMTVDLIREAKARGVPVTAETCPQYLAFDAEAFDRVGVFAKCNPPLKTQDDIQALWEGIRDGTLDLIATDHSPFTVEEKERTADDIWAAPPGFPGVEVLTQYVMGRAVTGDLSFTHATELVAGAPARIFNQDHRKGRIAIGLDADLTIYDPEPLVTLQSENFTSRSGRTGRIWDGLEVQGQTAMTIVRGRMVARGGKVTVEPGCGQIIYGRASLITGE